jgi:sugar phosphate isomerase/epimerase
MSLLFTELAGRNFFLFLCFVEGFCGLTTNFLYRKFVVTLPIYLLVGVTMKPISIQLYTLRPNVYPEGADLPSVLRTVADIGYMGVEFAGLHGYDPREIRKVLDDLGLKCSGSHCGIPTKDNVAKIADTELALGNTKCIGGFGPDQLRTLDDCKQAAAKMMEAVELLKPYGMTLGFHNHWWEFEQKFDDGRTAYDVLMDEAPEVFSELDTYWTAWGKVDPASILEKYGSRIPLLHIKDGNLEQPHPHLAVGDGKMDFHSIVKAMNHDIVEWLVVELDAYNGPMIEAVRKSYEYLTREGLALGSR